MSTCYKLLICFEDSYDSYVNNLLDSVAIAAGIIFDEPIKSYEEFERAGFGTPKILYKDYHLILLDIHKIPPEKFAAAMPFKANKYFYMDDVGNYFPTPICGFSYQEYRKELKYEEEAKR